MRILLIGLNFWPEPTGIGKYSGEMAKYLQNKGHQVTVITTPPYYPQWKIQLPYQNRFYSTQNWNGISIIRCPIYVPKKITGLKRIIHLISFMLSALPVMICEKSRHPDLIFTVEPTLFAVSLAGRSGTGKRAKTWLHVQDFELDAALNLGFVKRIPFMEKTARSWEAKLYRKFAAVSTISHAMEKRLLEKGVDKAKIRYFPNWIDTSLIHPMTGENSYRKGLSIPPSDIVLLFSGSIGKKQSIETIIKAAELISKDEHIHFVICGEGPEKSHLQRLAQNLTNIHFLPIQPAESLNELLNMADIHLLPQMADAADLVMPSKLLGMLASGRPVIATCTRGTELFETVNDLGISVPPEDPHELVKAILALAQDKKRREELGTLGRRFVMDHFASDKVLNEMNTAITDLVYPQPLGGV